MFLFWFTFVLAVIGSNATGELCVLHSPDSLTFVHTSETMESLLSDIFSAALGLSVEHNSEWEGMYVMDPFNTPEAVMNVYIDGVSSLSEYAGLNSKIYQLTANHYEPDTFKGIKLRILQRLDNGGRGNKIVNIKLSDKDRLRTIRNVFGNVSSTSYKANPVLRLSHLKPAVKEDRQFIYELRTLRAIIGKVKEGGLISDNLIDFYNFRFRTLHLLSDFYGPNSRQTNEAKKLLGDDLQELNKAIVKAYDGSVLVTVVTADVAHSRRSARSLKNPPGHSEKFPYEWREPIEHSNKPNIRRQDDETNEGGGGEAGDSGDAGDSGGEGDGGEGGDSGGGEDSGGSQGGAKIDETIEQPEDNAAIFNILLWFGVVMWICVLAIVYTCMDMDPGRDSIIYRMTSMRTKKDV